MKPKPKIEKGSDGWQVVRPRAGFGGPEVRSGFPTRDAAWKWLERAGNRGSSSASFDRTATPNGRLSYGQDAWPVIIR